MEILAKYPLKIWSYYREIQEVNHFNPYIGNITASFLITGKYMESKDIKGYIRWYLENTDNKGVMHDFLIYRDFSQKKLDFYDSIDGYVGSFLILFYLYVLNTGDRDFFIKNKKCLLKKGFLLFSLKNEKGLFEASYDKKVSYLMDNMEVYGGFVSLSRLLKKVGDDRWKIFQDEAYSLKNRVLEMFYDKEKGVFNWAIKGDEVFKSNCTILYPDLVAQLFPLMYGILRGEKRKNVMGCIGKINPFVLPKEQYFVYCLSFRLERLFSSFL